MTDRPSSQAGSWGVIPTTPPAGLFGERLSRRLFADRAAALIVRFGGIAIIASILAIMVVILAEVAPLLRGTKSRPLPITPGVTVGRPLAVGVEEYREVAFEVDHSGIDFLSLRTGKPLPGSSPDLGGAEIVSVSALHGSRLALGLSDGRVLPIRIDFKTEYSDAGREVQPSVVTGPALTIGDAGRAARLLDASEAPSGPVIAAVVGARSLSVVRIVETPALIGEPRREEARATLELPIEGEVSTLAADERGEEVAVGTSLGELVRVGIGDSLEVRERRPVGQGGAAVSALGWLIGDRTLVAADGGGHVSSWQILPSDAGGTHLERIHEFKRHGAPVVAVAPSRRNKGFLTADERGLVQFHFATTGETLLGMQLPDSRPVAVSFAPKADAMVVADAAGRLHHWEIEAPHLEATLRSLFGKVWYEGYRGPEYVWQSTGGSDDFEPKMSLTPLIYGTLKGTFYALILAVPLALLGALYASQFLSPRMRGTVKPAVEIMAALPSVVLGFIAGLWLAPAVERIVPGLLLAPLVVGALAILAAWLWRFAPRALRARIRPGAELLLLVPVVVAGGWIALRLGAGLEASLLGGDYRRWLLEALGLTYDQRNSLVVGLAMGFAVIPIMFTIAEDSLSSVPPHMTAGSLALGATPWQTALFVVLPTASPGIFSAVMIGFGRAVGETMIVLMATGNTPVMDGSIFSGFRALSANIAVELPEAPEGGTLYRVLFLAALLLFVTTFIVNTLAELVRIRLRRRYRVL